MSKDSPLPFLPLLSEVVQEIAPGLLAELISWKCCRRCGGICNWASSDFSAVTGSLICPHCRAFIVEWPAGLPIVCACGVEVDREYLVLDGLPVSNCCGLSLLPPAECSPDRSDDVVPASALPAPLRVADGGPGVEGAEPSQRFKPPEWDD